MTELIERVCKTVRQVRDVEVMGSLFQALCEMEGHGSASKLLDYKSHRFLGLTQVIKRVLDRWTELTHWYEARIQKARRERKVVPVFLLENDRLELVQLLSLLLPITALNKKSQGEGCGQVETLLTLYRLRVKTLNVSQPLADYRAPVGQPCHFSTAELTPLIAKTRSLLAAAFDKNYFSRYLDRAKIRAQSFVFEMQVLLHPSFKNLDLNMGAVARLCAASRDIRPEAGARIAEFARDAVIGKARSIMIALAADDAVPPPVEHQQLAFSEELVDLFGSVAEPALPADVREGQVDEELQRWRAEPNTLARQSDGKPELILQFWKRQADNGNYKYLPKLARALFALPTSSAQIERDFGSSGNMVTARRTNLSGYNVEMSSFLNANREFINIPQCERLSAREVAENIPSHILLGALDDDDADAADIGLLAFFSGAGFDDGDDDDP